MIGVYLSGTGNTKYCMEQLFSRLDPSAEIVSIEQTDVVEKLKGQDIIILGHPIQFSNAPKMVRDFILENKAIWHGKKVFCIATMGLFSGDGAGCSARLLKKCGAQILGGLHIKMPDAVADSKALKKPLEKNQQIVREAQDTIEKTVKMIQNNQYPQDGIGPLYHIAGLFGQRLWFYGKTKNYSDKLKVSDACTGCGLCAKQCPMKNLTVKEHKVTASNHCTMCYRCISSCPQQALTLLGKKVVEQVRIEKYL